MSYSSFRRTLATGLLLGGLLTSGCAQEQEALVVLHSPVWSGANDCSVTPSNEVALAAGLLDVRWGTPYTMPVILQNQLLTQQPMTSNNGIDNGELQLTTADVSLRMPQAPDVLADVEAANPAYVEFTSELASISLGSGERQGFLVDIITQGAADAFAESIAARLSENSRVSVLADVVFKARRTGNRVGSVGEIEARTYTYPVELCIDCLYSCGGCADPGLCPLDQSTGIAYGVCGNAQDFLVGPPGCTDPNNDN